MSVSYLISSYNKAQYLHEVLASTYVELSQTGGEIIIIDDGSKDDSWEMITKFAQSDSRVAAHRQKNNGIFQVTNQLFHRSAQQWIRYVDCDDPLIAGSTQALVRLAEDRRLDYVYGQMVPYGPASLYSPEKVKPDYAMSLHEVLKDPLLHAIVSYNHVPSAALMRRSAIDPPLDLPEDLLSCQDLALAVRVFAKGRVGRLMTPVCWQLVGVTNRLSSREELTYHQTVEILKRYGAKHFNERYKRLAAKKVLSRSLRWMRKQRPIAEHPARYAALYATYLKVKLGIPFRWEEAMTLAATPFAESLKNILRDRQVY